jgi:hypothetical protein
MVGPRARLRRRAVLAVFVCQCIRAATVTEDTRGPEGVEVLVTTLAGKPLQRGYADGVGTNARFDEPQVLSSRFALAPLALLADRADATFAGARSGAPPDLGASCLTHLRMCARRDARCPRMAITCMLPTQMCVGRLRACPPMLICVCIGALNPLICVRFFHTVRLCIAALRASLSAA